MPHKFLGPPILSTLVEDRPHKSVNLPSRLVQAVDQAIADGLTYAISRDDFVRRWVEHGLLVVYMPRRGKAALEPEAKPRA